MVTTERNIRTNQSTAQGRENEKTTYFPGIIPTVGDIFIVCTVPVGVVGNSVCYYWAFPEASDHNSIFLQMIAAYDHIDLK